MLLLLCIMSDTDSELGNFSCHRQGWQLFWIQQCEIRDHVGVSTVVSRDADSSWLVSVLLTKIKTPYSVSGLIDTALVW